MTLEPFEERVLLAVDGPVLLAAIPSSGALIEEGTTLGVAPNELLLRFDSSIDPATLQSAGVSSIQFKRGGDRILDNGNDVPVTPGLIEIGDNPFDVIVRFEENLPNDLYQMTIVGSGANPLRDTGGLAFHAGEDLDRTFSLDLGAQIVAVVPQPVTRGENGQLSQAVNMIDVYFNANDPLDSAAALDASFYQLIRTKGTATPQDDEVFNPIDVTYSSATGKAVLTFASQHLMETDTYRLRIGNDDPLPLDPVALAVGPAGSSFDTAADLGPVFPAVRGTQSVNFSGTIAGDPVQVVYPGGPGEPGTRDNQVQGHFDHIFDTLEVPPNTTGEIRRVEYNFKPEIGTVLGATAFNSITDIQKERVREALSYFSHFLGVEFVETTESGPDIWIFATGDPRAVDFPAALDGGGTAVITGLNDDFEPLVVLNASIDWGASAPRGTYFDNAMFGVGSLLGLGRTDELPPLTVMGNRSTPVGVTPAEGVFPGDADIVLGQFLHPPAGNDVRMYSFSLPQAGTLNVETFAERLREFDSTLDPSQLDSVISVYDSTGKLLARNDDYYGNDSFLQLDLTSGAYFVAVTSTGNTGFDPAIPDTGFGGTTQGSFELRLTFTPDTTSGIKDTTGTLLDGDADGREGGVANFWFDVNLANTIFVDKASTSDSGPLGSISNPFTTISNALGAAAPGSIVRIAGNGGTDGLLGTVEDNLSYNVGFNSLEQPLSDGSTMNVPRGVTVMIDAGAVIKLRAANVNVGSFAQGIDRSEGALQVLGTPATQTVDGEVQDVGSVYFTSYYNNEIGTDPGTAKGTRAKGNWGGLVFRDDSDLESKGIFLNYVNHASLSFGGGQVVVDSVLQTFDAIHLETARPTISFNTISRSANAPISADPNSFEESQFQSRTFAASYTRIGPKVHGNSLSSSSINGLFVRIRTEAGANLDPLTVPARFNSTDVVYVIDENLVIAGRPGGYFIAETGLLTARPNARLAIDPGVLVKLGGARIETQIGAQFIAEGTADRPIVFTSVFDDRFGRGGTSDTTNDGDSTTANEGDWGGLFFGPLSIGSVDRALITFGGGSTTIEGGFAKFSAVEIHQAQVRLTNSTLERNAAGGESGNRSGRGSSTPSVIFVRGAQPVILDNIIQDNDTGPNDPNGPRKNTAAISINVNALNSKFVTGPGRRTGLADIKVAALTNSGPLVRGNLIDNTPINGMVVRGGVVTTDVVWDDTDIAHVVLDQIVANTQFSLSGRIRLQSTADASLVVKLLGENAGLTATGVPLDINDRSGGAVQIIGMGNQPVVMTSLFDTTVGAGFTPGGEFQTDTYNLQGEDLPPQPGDWRSVKLDDFSNDRNVDVVNEVERGFAPTGDVNRLPTTAQFLGDLAKDLKSGDDVRRLGYEIHGAISQTVADTDGGDVDVYSFRGTAGSVVWFDIDRTTQGLDTVVELVDANGAVVARSNNSVDEQPNPNLLVGSAGPLQPGFDGTPGPFTRPDFYTTNPMDAGMRVILPGTPGVVKTYFVRVRASSPNLTVLGGGLSKGRYVLQTRLQNVDEFPGSIVRHADIRYATIGVDVVGKPADSPLLGDTASSSLPHDTFETAQDIGNLLASDRNEISVAGALSTPTDVQWFKMDLNYDLVQSLGGLRTFAAMFAVQYADGLARPDTTISVFDKAGNLLVVGRDSQTPDAQPRPTVGADSANLSHGSFGVRDPMIGTVQLPAGFADTNPTSSLNRTYYVAVTSNAVLPTILDATFKGADPNDPATDPFVRLEPINSLARVAEDRIEGPGNSTADTPPRLFNEFGDSVQQMNLQAVPHTLEDVVLFGMVDNDLVTINPFTGQVNTFITDPIFLPQIAGVNTTANPVFLTDIAMRDDGRFYTFYRGDGAGANGTYTQFSPTDGTLMEERSNPLPTFVLEEDEPVDPETGLYNYEPTDDDPGVQINAMAFSRDSGLISDNLGQGLPGDPFSIHNAGRMLYVVGNRAPGRGITQTASQNLLIRLDPSTGAPFDFDLITNADVFPPPDGTTFTAYQPFGGSPTESGTEVVPRGTLETGVFLMVPDGDDLPDGTRFSVFRDFSEVATFEMDEGGGGVSFGIPIVFDSSDDGHEIATTIASVVSSSIAAVGADVQFDPNQLDDINVPDNVVRLRGGEATFGFVDRPFKTDAGFSGAAPDITGLSFLSRFTADLAPDLFAVSGDDFGFGGGTFSFGGGGVYQITDYDGGFGGFPFPGENGAELTLLNIVDSAETGFSFFDDNATFSSLTEGPPNVEGGRYARTMFSSDPFGNLYAFDASGQPVDVFDSDLDGVADASTVFSGIERFDPNAGEVRRFFDFNYEGLAFSTVDYNLWHVTELRGGDEGHGVATSFDNHETRTDPQAGEQSFYFGLEDQGASGVLSEFLQPGALNYRTRPFSMQEPRELSGNPALFQSFNVPGGAHGSLQTAAFNLEGVSGADKPTLYFNYALDTEGANGGPTDMRDSFRVFARSGDRGPWLQLATNNSIRTNDSELPRFFSFDGGLYKGDAPKQRVQEAFDPAGIENLAPVNPNGVLYERRTIDEPYPTTAAQWRQARVDLGDLAGLPDVRLRFDFSTAGTMNEMDVPLPGDEFGLFNTNYRVVESPTTGLLVEVIDFHEPGARRGQNNAHQGVFIDDVIVGFAGRGEMVTGHFTNTGGNPPAGVTTFTEVPNVPGTIEIQTGRFQLDVRRGTEYGESISPLLREIELFRTIPGNGRLAQGFSLLAPPASEITQGDTFAINTLFGTVTFEFRFSGLPAEGNIAVNLDSGDSAQTVAEKIRDAINNVAPSANFNVKAGAGAEVVDLFGGEDVDPGPLGLTVHNLLGDTVPQRIQGQTILQGNRIGHTLDAGIVIRPVGDPETGEDTVPGHTGSVAHLPTLNTAQLVPGVTIRENVIFDAGQVGILFSGNPITDIAHAVPFGRILNNTIAQTTVGIQVLLNASPTIINNIVAETDTAITVDATSTSTVVGATIYQNNGENLVGVSETNAIFLLSSAPLFVDSSRKNFYLQEGSLAIDSSVNSLQERPALKAVTSPMGIPPSPIQASDFDLLGQLRVDDPLVDSPPGLGSNVFKDRGALERADFAGPTAVLINPVDNDAGGIDRDPQTNQLLLANQLLTDFTIQLVDGAGVGIDDSTVNIDQFVIERDDSTEPLVPNVDYTLSYDANGKIARLSPPQGIWINGDYTITLNNDPVDGIKDLAGNALQPNVPPDVRFVIKLTDQIASSWQNPENKFDVSGNGRVSGLDLLQVINAILAGRGGPLPIVPEVPPYLDVSGDSRLSAIDVLQLINFFLANQQGAAAPAVTPSAAQDADLPTATPAATATDSDSVAVGLAMSDAASEVQPEDDSWMAPADRPTDAAQAPSARAASLPMEDAGVLAATMEPEEFDAFDSELDSILTDLTEDF